MTFEDYLIDKHADQYQGLDDDMNEDYEEWLQWLEIDDWIELGDKYGRSITMDSYNDVIKRMDN